VTNVTAVNIPANETAVVGIGQSANCADGLVLTPSSTILQLNGDACASPLGYTSCAAHGSYLQMSECIATCKDSILPTLSADGVLECVVPGHDKARSAASGTGTIALTILVLFVNAIHFGCGSFRGG